MVDAAEFPTLVQRSQVRGVSRTVINERPAFAGALPPDQAMRENYTRADPRMFRENPRT